MGGHSPVLLCFSCEKSLNSIVCYSKCYCLGEPWPCTSLDPPLSNRRQLKRYRFAQNNFAYFWVTIEYHGK